MQNSPDTDLPVDDFDQSDTSSEPVFAVTEPVTEQQPESDLPSEEEVFGIMIDPDEEGFSVDEKVASHISAKDKPKKHDSYVSFLNTTLGDFLKRMDSDRHNVSNEKLVEKYGAEAVAMWEATVAAASSSTATMIDRGVRRVRRKGSHWTQTPSYEGKNIVANRPRLATGESGQLLTGEMASLMTMAMTSEGATIQVPLWDTGIWVSIKQPKLQADINFIQRLSSERIQLGRETRGIIFGSDNVYMTSFLFDYVLDHVFATSLKVNSIQDLRKYIKTTDLLVLAWALAGLLNPHGFPFAQPCTYDISQCIHVEEEMIAIYKLLWVDNGRLTDSQRKHMCTRRKDVTVEEITRYQESLNDSYTVPNTAVLVDRSTPDEVIKTELVFQVPLLEEQIVAGRSWIDDVVQSAEAAFGQSLSGTDRENYLRIQTQASQVRRYSHWIKEILFTRGEKQYRIVDREEIDKQLVAMTSDKETRNVYSKIVNNFIEDRGMTIIGFPNYECPNCKKVHLTPKPGQIIVPIDPVSVFSILQRYRLQENLTDIDMF